jgi:hypothetical protein
MNRRSSHPSPFSLLGEKVAPKGSDEGSLRTLRLAGVGGRAAAESTTESTKITDNGKGATQCAVSAFGVFRGQRGALLPPPALAGKSPIGARPLIRPGIRPATFSPKREKANALLRRPAAPQPPPLLGVLAALALLGSLAAGQAHAQSDNDLHGRLELSDAGLFSNGDSIEAALGAEDSDEALANLRLTWEPTWGPWSLQIHGVAAIEDGPAVALSRAEATLLPAPPATWLNLTDTFASHGDVLGQASIDRLALAYTTPDLVVRIGRQAITWGSGLVFRPMDLFDPFSPSATDTEWKPGVDMLYVQRLFADGSDVQFILAPRPARLGGPVTADASSAALHIHTTIAGHETTLLLARDHGDWVGGLGVNGALGGATWNVELVPTFLRVGGTRVSGIANISDGVTLLGHNATVFAEYFHNGFGDTNRLLTLETLPPDLEDRLVRGQLFNTRRDYLAGGMTLEVDPLFTVSPTLIADLNDGSRFALLAGTWSLSDNLTLIAGAQAPLGPARTEFGGLPLSPSSPILFATPAQLYVQLRRYF